MFNVEKKDELVSNYLETVGKGVEVVSMYGDIKKNLVEGNSDMARYLINKLFDVFQTAIPKDLKTCPVTKLVSMKGNGEISLVDVSIKNKYAGIKSFSFTREFLVNETVDEDILLFILDVFKILVTDAIAEKNLEIINGKLEEIGKEAGNSFKVSFTTDLGADGRDVVVLTDDSVVYSAANNKIFKLNDILVLYTPDELISEEKIKNAFNKEVGAFANAQTTAQFIGVHSPLVDYIANVSKLVKASTIIKKVYPKKASKIGVSKKVVEGYELEDKIFSALRLDENGNKVVILAPFNIDTLELVK